MPLLAFWAADAELMDIWPVCVCAWNVYILCVYIHDGDVSAEHFNNVYVHACPFGRGQPVLGTCHVVPAGCSSHVGGDRWTKFSFPMVYNSDRQREEQRARETQHYRERFNHWNGEEKNPLKKEPCCFKVEKIPKIGSTKRRMLCQQHLVDERETEIDFYWCAQTEYGENMVLFE